VGFRVVTRILMNGFMKVSRTIGAYGWAIDRPGTVEVGSAELGPRKEVSGDYRRA